MTDREATRAVRDLMPMATTLGIDTDAYTADEG